MWPFKRRPRRIEPAQSYETWRTGDVAECVADDSDPWLHEDGEQGTGPVMGTRWIVARAGIHQGSGAIVIRIVGWPEWFCAAAFRKIVDVGVEEPRKLAWKRPAPTVDAMAKPLGVATYPVHPAPCRNGEVGL